MTKSVNVTRDEGVVRIELNRPEKLNAIAPEMFREVQDVLEEMTLSNEDRVLVITGAGGNFCSGADMSSSAPSVRRLTRMREVGDLALALQRLPQPSIAMVRGVAVGAGCNIALGCDLVVAGTSARFSEIFVKRGLSLDCGGSWLLPRIVGMQNAKRLTLLGEVIDARTAHEMGLVVAVVDDDELEPFVDGWARTLAAGPPVAMALSKAMLNQSIGIGLQEALTAEGMAQTINFNMADAVEGRLAFVEKRPARFTGT